MIIDVDIYIDIEVRGECHGVWCVVYAVCGCAVCAVGLGDDVRVCELPVL
jgi:hypothetical protein